MRVLVVEDEPKMLALLEEGLSAAGFRVTAVGDGEGALAYAAVEAFDAIVLDVMLPGLDGFEVVRSLRARDNATPVLMLTARDAVRDRVSGLDGGADDYLVKPFAFAELASRLRALARRGKTVQPTVLRCGPLTLDPSTHVVTVGGEPIELTAREFALLEYLLRHRGQVLSRPMIIEQVWDHAYDGYSNVVDVYVGYLRQKLDSAHGPDLIHTVRGVGYQLRCPETA
jgi:two-component system OmpR family response regulator